MSIPDTVVAAARQAILQQYPDMEGMDLSAEAAPVPGKYIVTGQKTITTADGGSLAQVVHATVDEDGNILRISASR